MNRSRERVRSLRSSEAVILAITLAVLVSILVTFPSRSASAVAPSKTDYRLQGKLSTSVGTAPALQKIGPRTNTFTTATVDGSSRRVLSFPKGNGLKLDTAGLLSSNGIYTVVVLFELNNVSNFKRIVDFKNGTSDNGLYVQNGRLRLFPGSSTGATPIAANRYVQVVITRDLLGTVSGYVDGSLQFQFDDAASQDAVIGGEDVLRFFKDNTSGGTTGEDSGGSVARIRLYDVALSANDVGTLDRLEPTIFRVNSNADLADVNLADGKCQTVNPGECTLRAAVEQTNRTSGDDAINFASLASGTITLTGGQHLSVANEPDSLTINGPGARTLTVSGNNAGRVFRLADDASAVINNLRISNGNSAFGGGGISTDGDLLTLNNVTVSGNQAASGGGIYNTGNNLKLSKTTVSGNSATNGVGGGIFNSGTLTLNNSTVSGNQATSGIDPSFGGGISNATGTLLTLNDSTISNNSIPGASGSGGGINNGGTAILRNTLVANNSAATAPDANGTYDSQGKNLVGNTSGFSFTGSGVLSGPPRLGQLQNNGGPTNTHALLSGSLAIDVGSNTNCPSTDQRGVSRPRDGDDNGRTRCDVGSYEKK